MRDQDRVAQDGVFAIRVGGGYEAVDEGLARDDVGLQDVEVEKGGFGCADEAGGGLGDDAGAFGGMWS